ncbi:hypothetical protein M3225_27205 [Priestia aryabhattai]|nr:hypothetical protein [Priestia aryabhattai]MCM3774107.1 hypothetical protein [Priestia aryabhattai]
MSYGEKYDSHNDKKEVIIKADKVIIKTDKVIIKKDDKKDHKRGCCY